MHAWLQRVYMYLPGSQYSYLTACTQWRTRGDWIMARKPVILATVCVSLTVRNNRGETMRQNSRETMRRLRSSLE